MTIPLVWLVFAALLALAGGAIGYRGWISRETRGAHSRYAGQYSARAMIERARHDVPGWPRHDPDRLLAGETAELFRVAARGSAS